MASPPLEGVRVLDLSTVVAGPLIGRNLADFGAEVIKVEHPGAGDPARSMGWHVEGRSLWFKALNRNKLPITLNLSDPRGAELCRALAAKTDVVIESFRPGTLERWGLAPDELRAAHAQLIVVRVSGFGQTGPYSGRPGFGTLAEAISGYAGSQGLEDEPPQLPAIPLADQVAGLWGTIATLLALRHRERGGPGQVVDVSLYESLFALLDPAPALYDLTGRETPRLGNRLPFVALRGAYRSADDQWLALSGTSQPVARRILHAVGGEELAEDPRFATPEARMDHADELDEIVAEWVAQRSLDAALETLEEHDAAAAPVYRMADAFEDPHFKERGTIERVEDEELGQVAMPGVVPRLSETPGVVRWAGGTKGAANDRVFGDLLSLSEEERTELAEQGVI